MRLMAILVVVAGLSGVGASPAAAQLPEAPLPVPRGPGRAARTTRR